MKRAFLAIFGSIYGLFALLAYQPPTTMASGDSTGTEPIDPFVTAGSQSESADDATNDGEVPTEISAITTTTVPELVMTTIPEVTTTAETPTTKAPTTTAAPRVTTTTAAQLRTVRGAVVNTQYGDIQVAIRVQGKNIVDVATVKYPVADSVSAEINHTAVPKLNKAALQAKSSNIATVSGATLTSDGYKTSLQSAIDTL